MKLRSPDWEAAANSTYTAFLISTTPHAFISNIILIALRKKWKKLLCILLYITHSKGVAEEFFNLTSCWADTNRDAQPNLSHNHYWKTPPYQGNIEQAKMIFRKSTEHQYGFCSSSCKWNTSFFFSCWGIMKGPPHWNSYCTWNHTFVA